jgi:hypothetical protein
MCWGVPLEMLLDMLDKDRGGAHTPLSPARAGQQEGSELVEAPEDVRLLTAARLMPRITVKSMHAYF